MEGEAVETCAQSFPNPKNQNRGKNDFSSFLAAVANKVSTSLSDISSKPFSYAFVFVVLMAGMLSLRSGLFLLGQAKRKSPFGGGEPRQA